MGQGEACCCYLVSDSKGFFCARVLGDLGTAWNIDDRIRKGTINAKGLNCGGRYST